MTTCRRVGCTNPVDMYSRSQLCEKHEKIRQRQLSYMLLGRVFAIFQGTLAVIGLVSAIANVNNWFDEDITFIWNVSLMMVGIFVFIKYYRSTRYVTFS